MGSDAENEKERKSVNLNNDYFWQGFFFAVLIIALMGMAGIAGYDMGVKAVKEEWIHAGR